MIKSKPKSRVILAMKCTKEALWQGMPKTTLTRLTLLNLVITTEMGLRRQRASICQQWLPRKLSADKVWWSEVIWGEAQILRWAISRCKCTWMISSECSRLTDRATSSTERQARSKWGRSDWHSSHSHTQERTCWIKALMAPTWKVSLECSNQQPALLRAMTARTCKKTLLVTFLPLRMKMRRVQQLPRRHRTWDPR